MGSRHVDDDWQSRTAQVRERLDLPPLPVASSPGGLWAVTMVKDEADIIERIVRQLFAQGVDGILVADNGSTDETLAILERLASELPVFIAHDREPAYYQAVKMTLLSDWARQAGAEWIIPFDADELWFAPGDTLKGWLGRQEADVVSARLHNLYPSNLAGGWALDRQPHLHTKVAFRAHPEARLTTGNHFVERPGKRTVGLHIVHIPWRSYDQFARKVRNGAKALALTDLAPDVGGHWRATGSLPDEALQALWTDLRVGLANPALGWSPVGWGIPLDVTGWMSWDPDGVLRRATGGAAWHDEASNELTVIYGLPPGPGWDPITLMARQAASLLGAHYIEVTVDKEHSRLKAASGLLPRRRGRGACLVIAPQPVHLGILLHRDYWVTGYDTVVGWVLDPLAGDRLPRLARGRGHFDRLFVTDGELVDDWARQTRTPTSCLPWGADVLGLGPLRTDRPVDLLGLGRQPGPWADDDATAAAASEAGVSYRGRPGLGSLPLESQQTLTHALSRAKFALAFSDVKGAAADALLTHEFLVGGALALGAGASLAGVPPRSLAIRELLWDGALLEFDTADRAAGLAAIREAVADWTPQKAVVNRAEALRRLDWRWRYQELAGALGVHSLALEADLTLLGEKLDEAAAVLR